MSVYNNSCVKSSFLGLSIMFLQEHSHVYNLCFVYECLHIIKAGQCYCQKTQLTKHIYYWAYVIFIVHSDRFHKDICIQVYIICVLQSKHLNRCRRKVTCIWKQILSICAGPSVSSKIMYYAEESLWGVGPCYLNFHLYLWKPLVRIITLNKCLIHIDLVVT